MPKMRASVDETSIWLSVRAGPMIETWFKCPGVQLGSLGGLVQCRPTKATKHVEAKWSQNNVSIVATVRWTWVGETATGAHKVDFRCARPLVGLVKFHEITTP